MLTFNELSAENWKGKWVFLFYNYMRPITQIVCDIIYTFARARTRSKGQAKRTREDRVSCIQFVYTIPYRRAPSASREQRYIAYKYTICICKLELIQIFFVFLISFCMPLLKQSIQNL